MLQHHRNRSHSLCYIVYLFIHSQQHRVILILNVCVCIGSAGQQIYKNPYNQYKMVLLLLLALDSVHQQQLCILRISIGPEHPRMRTKDERAKCVHTSYHPHNIVCTIIHIRYELVQFRMRARACFPFVVVFFLL